MTQRNYIISSDPARGDRAGVDIFRAPTSDAVNVGIEGQVLFTLNTDPAVIKDFDTKYGLRTFPVTGGAARVHPYQGDEGFAAFLDVQFRPVLDNALRQEIAKYDCAQLNAACRLVRSSNQSRAATGTQSNGNLAQVQNAISQTLQSDLDSTLGGKFVQNVRFRVSQVTLSPQVNSAVDQANAAKAQGLDRGLSGAGGKAARPGRPRARARIPREPVRRADRGGQGAAVGFPTDPQPQPGCRQCAHPFGRRSPVRPMRALLEVLVVLLAAGALGLLVASVARSRTESRGRWRVVERSPGAGDVVLQLQCPGEQPLEVARIPASLEAVEFSDRLAEARAEADDRAAALNAGRARLRR